MQNCTVTFVVDVVIFVYLYSVPKKETLFFPRFILSIKRCMALYFNMTMPDPMQHATPHGFSPTTVSEIAPWPSTSPDLNPNKHTWNELQKHIRGRVNAPANVRELFQALKQK